MKTRLIPFLALALVACATATPYQPMRNGEGYADQKLEMTRYRITFAGNSQTPRQTVENYLLYRAAELTLNNGFDYFMLADRSTEADTSYNQTIQGSGGFGHFGYGRRGGFGVGVGIGTSTPIKEYEAQADILMYKGTKPDSEVNAFDARQVKENLESVIVRPETETVQPVANS